MPIVCGDLTIFVFEVCLIASSCSRIVKGGRAYTGSIELREVSRFAYGTIEGTGNIGIWAAGKAGWFMIDPSAVYAQIYQHMVAAVKIFHFLEDQYRPYRRGKRKFKGTVKDLFAMVGSQKISQGISVTNPR
jgi:hypothetical protein